MYDPPRRSATASLFSARTSFPPHLMHGDGMGRGEVRDRAFIAAVRLLIGESIGE